MAAAENTGKTVRIVRWKPRSSLFGQRVLTVKDFEKLGIFTQKKSLVWDKRSHFWLDVDQAQISPEALKWLQEQKEFSVEEQKIEGETKA